MIPAKTSLEFDVRKATRADASEVVAGINQICQEGGAFITQHYIPTDAWESVLGRTEESADHLLLAVAVLDKKIIGAGRLFAGGPGTLYRHVADMGIFVLAPYRHMGVGHKLFEYMLDWARSKSLKKISLIAIASNHIAISFFKKNGFEMEGRLRQHIDRGDHFDDVCQMALFLG